MAAPPAHTPVTQQHTEREEMRQAEVNHTESTCFVSDERESGGKHGKKQGLHFKIDEDDVRA